MTTKLAVVKVLREVRAWDLGGGDWMGEANERVRVKGGRALYEQCCAFANRSAPRDVRLGRVDSTEAGLNPVARWVDGDATLEIVEVKEN